MTTSSPSPLLPSEDCPSPSTSTSSTSSHPPRNASSVAAACSVGGSPAPARPTTTTTTACQQHFLPPVFGFVLPTIFLLVGSLIFVAMYARRRTRRELEGGRCNLPTVVWRPRFMNYYTAQEDNPSEDDGVCWNNDDAVAEWAKTFWEEHRSAPVAPTDGRGANNDSGTPRPNYGEEKKNEKKKMGSSSITNILPRMERLKGPYGMYATVYGVRTKVVHVAHPVPARAILTGAGAVDVGGMGGGTPRAAGRGNGRFSHSWKNALRTLFRRTDCVDIADGRPSKHRPTPKENREARRRSSSLRMLTGSTKYPAYDHFKNFSGEGVFTASGPDWKAKRASVIHCLLRGGGTERSLEAEANGAADSFEREISRARAESGECANEKSGAGGRKGPVTNVVPMLQRSTIALIYRLITHRNVEFGPGSVRNEENKRGDAGGLSSSDRLDSATSSVYAASLASTGEEASEGALLNDDASPSTATTTAERSDDGREAKIKSLLPEYLRSVTKIRMIILAQSRSVWYLLPRLVYRALSPMYREEERTMGPIREFARLTCEGAAPGSPLALLSQRSSHSSAPESRATVAAPKRGGNVPVNVSKDLLDEAITLLFAGQDTSAATLSWTLHLLSLYPEKQKRAAEEVRSVLGESRTKPIISKNMISRMSYLDAVIKESMRLYPVAPFIVRKLTADITIPNDEAASPDGARDENADEETISVPASTFACVWIYALHRNPRLWHRPDDFVPERWIDPALRRRDPGQEEHGAYIPFAIGPRNCLGQPLAQVILRILLARILNRFVAIDPRFEALQRLAEAEGAKFDSKVLRKDMQAGFTVLPSDGLKLRLTERI